MSDSPTDSSRPGAPRIRGLDQVDRLSVPLPHGAIRGMGALLRGREGADEPMRAADGAARAMLRVLPAVVRDACRLAG